MESLYRTYRPQTFEDVVGQRHVVSTLEHAVLDGRESHAYLFCGPRGTGKTTMARILAKALNCELGPGHLPDGTCGQCQLIAAGEHPDVLELDAASRTGVDNVREEIINRVGFAPSRGRYKIYIIDEVHMLTVAAFNALLKTLEEPPAHVVFVLCTTDPQKIPETILSRVQRFDFHPISTEEIVAHLIRVCESEGFTYDPAAIELIARRARGGMRDALSTLEQLSVLGDGAITAQTAQDLMGGIDASTLVKVARAMAERDVATLFDAVGELVDGGRDLLQFTRELTAYLRDVYVVCAVGPRPRVVDAGTEEVEQLAAIAGAFGPVDRVSRVLGVLGEASSEMRTAPNQRLVLELAFTRVARPEADLTLEALAERVAVLEQRLGLLADAGAQVAGGVGAGAVPQGAGGAAVDGAAAAGMDVGIAAGGSQRDTESQSQQPLAAQPSMTQPSQGEMQPTAQPQVQAPQPTRAQGVPPTAPPISQPQAPASQQTQQAPASAAQQASVPQRPPQHASAPAAQGAPFSPQTQDAPPQAQSAPSRTQPAASVPVTDPGDLQRRWNRVVDALLASEPARGSLLMNAVPLSDDGEKLLVSLPQGSGFALRMLERDDVRRAVGGKVSQQFGRRRVTYVESNAQAASAARPAAPGVPGAWDAASGVSAQPVSAAPQQASVAQPQPQPAPGTSAQQVPPAPAQPASHVPPMPPQPASRQAADLAGQSQQPTPAPAQQVPGSMGQPSQQPTAPAQPAPSASRQPAATAPEATTPQQPMGTSSAQTGASDVPPWEEARPEASAASAVAFVSEGPSPEVAGAANASDSGAAGAGDASASASTPTDNGPAPLGNDPEMERLVGMLTEVFGEGVKVRRGRR